MGPVELPVYHHWRFATGPAGDFQSLALAIRGRTVPATFGSRPIDLSTSGLGLADTDDAQVRLGGALRALDADPVAWSDPALPARFAAALTEVLNTPDQIPVDTPVLAPPRYGAAYRPAASLDPTVPARWYEQLNTDPTGRVTAALGVQVVQRDQETLVASAWDQAADLRAVASLGRLADAGIAMAERMQARHLAPLSAEVGVFVVAPLFPRLHLDPVVSASALARVLGGDDVPTQTFGATVRRARPGAGRHRAPREPHRRRAGASRSGRAAVWHRRAGASPHRRWPPGDARGARRLGIVARRPRVGAHAPGHLHRCAAATPVQRPPAVSGRYRWWHPAR